MTSLKQVIDTNILISAALTSQGAHAKLVQSVLAQHRLVFSQATFDELRTRFTDPNLTNTSLWKTASVCCAISAPVRFGWSQESLSSMAVIAMTTISLKLH